jgi:hypothetical protein
MEPRLGDRRADEDQTRQESRPDPSTLHHDAESITFHEHLERARRLVALELDLAETRRRVAEDNVKITEAQLELAEQQIEDLKAENARLRREIEELQDARRSS